MQFHFIHAGTVDAGPFPIQILNGASSFIGVVFTTAVFAPGVGFTLGLAHHHIDGLYTNLRRIRLPQDKVLQILHHIRREGGDHDAVRLPDAGAGMHWRCQPGRY